MGDRAAARRAAGRARLRGGARAARPRGEGDEDAATGILLVGALALGALLASDVYRSGAGVDRLLFGTLIGLSGSDLALTALAAALALAVLVAFVPRRRDPVAVAALGAATLIALQLALEHWFYLYIVWFLPLAFVALLAGRRIVSIDSAGDGREPEAVRMTTAISHGSSSEAS